PGFLAGLNLFDPTLFELEDQPAEYAAGNFDATERITAGYAQLEHRLNPRLSFITGLSVEQTKVEYRGFEFDVDDETVNRTDLATQSYTDVLPSLNVRYDVDNNTVVRGAWTNSLARPNYFDLVPYREISLDDNELATGNPALKPTRSMNLDLMAE